MFPDVCGGGGLLSRGAEALGRCTDSGFEKGGGKRARLKHTVMETRGGRHKRVREHQAE